MLPHVMAVLQLGTGVMSYPTEGSQVFKSLIASVCIRDMMHFLSSGLAEHAKIVVELQPCDSDSLPLVAGVVHRGPIGPTAFYARRAAAWRGHGCGINPPRAVAWIAERAGHVMHQAAIRRRRGSRSMFQDRL